MTSTGEPDTTETGYVRLYVPWLVMLKTVLPGGDSRCGVRAQLIGRFT
jgi:hypothetical protein